MQLSKNDLYLLSQCAISAAFHAGRIISNNSTKVLDVKNKKEQAKKEGSPGFGDTLASQVVTEVDIQCQDIILNVLRPTFGMYDLALLAEESPDDGSRHQKDFFWCIDPLDGTLAFTRSEPGYSVSIALVSREGIPQIGVIYDAYSNVLYHAIKGMGAYRNGKPWAPLSSAGVVNRKLNLITDKSFREHPRYEELIQWLSELVPIKGYSGFDIHFYGGAAMDACKVLELQPALFLKLPKTENGGGCVWDYAASSCIFIESDAHVSDMKGKPLDLNNPVTPFMNRYGVLYTTDKILAEEVLLKFP